jgi:hypothetical protein
MQAIAGGDKVVQQPVPTPIGNETPSEEQAEPAPTRSKKKETK